MEKGKKVSREKIYLKMLCLLVVLCGVAWCLHVAVSDRTNPHVAKTSLCSDCHLRDPVKITGEEGRTNLFVADIETLCLQCHREVTMSMSHPMAMKPSFRLPDDMYLDWKGEMTCITCHFMHEDSDRVYGRGNDRHLRRNSKGRAFCLECHQQGFLSQRNLSHALAAGPAHRSLYSEFDSPDRLGESSRQCLSCHDGSIAGDTGTMNLEGKSSGIWRHNGYTGSNSHPIGIDYRRAYRKNSREITEVSMLPSVITLPEGKVECVSCHNLYSKNESLLTVSNNGSRLCLSCHKK